jgi:hypothetical protein
MRNTVEVAYGEAIEPLIPDGDVAELGPASPEAGYTEPLSLYERALRS